MRNRSKEISVALVMLLLAVLLVLAFLWALSIGTVKLSFVQIYEGIVNQFTSGMAIETAGQGPVHDIIWLLRLPRLVLAALVGMGLSVCGVIMQAVERTRWRTRIFLVFLRCLLRCDGSNSVGHRRGAG